jgi:hypothetical protein
MVTLPEIVWWINLNSSAGPQISAPEPCAVNVLPLCEALPTTPTAPTSPVIQGEGRPGPVVTVIVDVAVLF